MKKFAWMIIATALFSASALNPTLAAAAKKMPTQAEVSQLLNINTASAQELTALPGIGLKKAQQIVAFRELNGKFRSVQELVNVKGIGTKMVAKLATKVKV